jgi:hypothetical protein
MRVRLSGLKKTSLNGAAGEVVSIGARVGVLLDDISLNARYVKFDVVFDPATIPKQCKRPSNRQG